MSIENTPPENSGNGQEAWVSCSDRMPTEENSDSGCVWWYAERFGVVSDYWDIPNDATHWMEGDQFAAAPAAPTKTQTDAPSSSTSPAAPAFQTQPKETE